MKKKLLTTAFLMTAATTFVVNAEQAEGVEKKDFASLKQTLVQKVGLEESLIKFNPELNKFMENVVGENYTTFQYQSQTRLISNDGERLISNLGAMYLINKETPLSDIVADFHFSKMDKNKWITEPLPEGTKKKGDIYIISDPTCGYCAKVESEKQQYVKAGIQMHYIPFPRSGVNVEYGSQNFLTALKQNVAMHKWVKAACAENPAQAYYEIALGKDEGKYDIDDKDIREECVEIVKNGYQFGNELGIGGTPYIYGVSVEGEKVFAGGYIPANNAAAQMGILIKDNRPKF